MADETPPGLPGAQETPADLGQRLEELIELLRRQLASASRGDFQEVLALGERAEATLEQVSRDTQQLRAFATQVRTIGRLRNKLCLSLAQQHQEAAEQLRRVRHGRKTLRAYRGT